MNKFFPQNNQSVKEIFIPLKSWDILKTDFQNDDIKKFEKDLNEAVSKSYSVRIGTPHVPLRSLSDWLFNEMTECNSDFSNRQDPLLYFDKILAVEQSEAGRPPEKFFLGKRNFSSIIETPFKNFRIKLRCIEWLLKNGVGNNISDSNDPLFLVYEPELVEILINAGANVNAYYPIYDDESLSVIDSVLMSALYSDVIYKALGFEVYLDSILKTLKVLLENGASPNGGTMNGRFIRHPLMVVCELKAENSTQECIRAQNDFLARAFDLLLEYGADPNCENNNGDTAVTICANAVLLKKLAKAGCDISHRNKEGKTLIDTLLPLKDDTAQDKTDNVDLITTYIDLGGVFDSSQLFNALECGGDIVRKMVKAGADINYRDTNGDVPAYKCFKLGYSENLKMVKLFKELGADLTIANYNGETLLHKWAEQLLEYTSSSFFGMPLGFSQLNLEILEFLVESGVDINAADNLGCTAAHRLAHLSDGHGWDKELSVQNKELLVQFLCKMIDLGADLDMKDLSGRVAMDYIKDKNCWKTVSAYIEHKRITDTTMEVDINAFER